MMNQSPQEAGVQAAPDSNLEIGESGQNTPQPLVIVLEGEAPRSVEDVGGGTRRLHGRTRVSAQGPTPSKTPPRRSDGIGRGAHEPRTGAPAVYDGRRSTGRQRAIELAQR